MWLLQRYENNIYCECCYKQKCHYQEHSTFSDLQRTWPISKTPPYCNVICWRYHRALLGIKIIIAKRVNYTARSLHGLKSIALPALSEQIKANMWMNSEHKASVTQTIGSGRSFYCFWLNSPLRLVIALPNNLNVKTVMAL